MMDDPVVFTDLVRNTLSVTTPLTITVITNFVESFGELLAENYGNTDTFVKYTYSVNSDRSAAQRILINNNINQGLKYMFF